MNQSNEFGDSEPEPQKARQIRALIALVAVSAAIDIGAQYAGTRTIVYIFKPLTMVFIIVIAMLTCGRGRRGYRILIVAGLCCSLVGDVFLMLPSDRFVPGLLSFLMAHLFYIVAFRTAPSRMSSAWLGAALVAYGGFMLWVLFPSLGSMKLPVSIYVAVILVMAWQAMSRWATKGVEGAGLAALGASLFVASDSLIAMNRFYAHFWAAELMILATYFTAQCLIALSTQSTGNVNRGYGQRSSA